MYKTGEYFENYTSDIDWYTKEISNTYYSIAIFKKWMELLNTYLPKEDI